MIETLPTVPVKLALIKFDNGQIYDERIRVRLARGLPLPCCYRAGNGGYAVRIGLGSRQWELGKHKERSSAVRFADMAIIYFWKYRKARKLPPTDVNVSLSVEQAKRDLVAMPECRALLDMYAKALITRGAITEPTPEESSPGYDYLGARHGLMKNMEELYAAVALASDHNPQLAIHFEALREKLASIKAYLATVDRILVGEKS